MALSLVANSKIVFLDEPTAGMDQNARRCLWSVLRKYKDGRVIILTTHNMDEAELLSDRVGIMSHGQLVCNGSPSFLKKTLGRKYQVILKFSDCKISH